MWRCGDVMWMCRCGDGDVAMWRFVDVAMSICGAVDVEM